MVVLGRVVLGMVVLVLVTVGVPKFCLPSAKFLIVLSTTVPNF
jgi:hypothetical protein